MLIFGCTGARHFLLGSISASAGGLVHMREQALSAIQHALSVKDPAQLAYNRAR